MDSDSISALGAILSGIGTILLVPAGLYAANIWRKQTLAYEKRSSAKNLLAHTTQFVRKIQSIRTNFRLYPEERNEIQRRMEHIQKEGGDRYDMIYDGVHDRLSLLNDEVYTIETLLLSLEVNLPRSERSSIRKQIEQIFQEYDELYSISREVFLLKKYNNEDSIRKRQDLVNSLIAINDPENKAQKNLKSSLEGLEKNLWPYVDMRRN
ncbi:hypothetical protein [Elioraea rosea]|uniref:hypothetical protein n=1 Tax=Elioraea rosea TaxID=2492390 RepID=UPI0011853809|nr:hypothetical protein [Elioraea rosea]